MGSHLRLKVDPVTTQPKGWMVNPGFGQIYGHHKTPDALFGGLMDSIGWYLSGYADGEGCFCVSFSKSKRHRFGWDIRPSFSVSQNSDRMELLYLFQKQFRCGSIRPDRSDKTFKFETRSVSELAHKVVPHFEKFPLLSSKHKDFELFACICLMMKHGEHLTRKGFNKVVELAHQMNPSGKRKYSPEEMMI